ncbi:MAG: MmgE/PrpD family protein [Pyrinomonadaceae bacterium]|nr:MmgE/PrpD family protein [Pyrinomonadaceae bacterium]MCX7640365.1 MmgE/PrpD family protein [Pyrinomonadaceae bacterium]MDW8304793.1 MmgE/PrpD family protein [Acidobacteriota bacterium]
MKKTISQIWAEYAYELKFEDLSAEAISAAKMFLYDSIGCALGGARTEDFRVLEETFREIGGPAECSVIGSSLKTDVRSASLINAVAIRALDYNDVYWKQDPSHPSDLLPAAFCVGEREGRNGKELLTAIVLAYELEMRLMEAAFPGLRELGIHHATLTAFVSPVVAGKMLRLTPEQMTNAIGISGSHSITLGAVTAGALTMMKNTVDPMATEAGVFAALLAKKGYKAPKEIFEGREGLFESIGEQWNPEVLTKGLGEGFKIAECSIKPFPSEALTHAPISAVLDLVFEHNLKPEEIESVEIYTLKRAAEILADEKKYVIDSRETADHSLPYCIAAAIVRRRLTTEEFSPEALRDEKILSNIQKIKAVLEPSFESRFPLEQPCRVVIKTFDGRILQQERRFPKGDPRDKLTVEELKEKFRHLANWTLGEKQQERIFETIYNLESVEKISDLMKLLVRDEIAMKA